MASIKTKSLRLSEFMDLKYLQLVWFEHQFFIDQYLNCTKFVTTQTTQIMSGHIFHK